MRRRRRLASAVIAHRLVRRPPSVSPTPRCFATELALLLLLLSLAGCQVAGSVRPSAKIGLVAPFEGRYRYIGYDVIYAVRLAIREANAAGGVAGHSIELVAYDDSGDPGAAAVQARKLDVDPQVFGVIGHFRETTTAAALDEYATVGLPLVAPDVYGFDATLSEGSVYVIAPPAHVLADGILDRALSLGPGSAALVTSGGPLGAAIRDAAQKRDPPVALIVGTYAEGGMTEVLAEDPGVVIIDASPVDAGDAAALLREAGWRGAIVGGPELAASDFAAVAGGSVTASCVTPWPLPQGVSGGLAFVEAYTQVSDGLPPGRLALPAYEATWILIEALENAILEHGTPSRQNVAQALELTERSGLLGTISFGTGNRWETATLYSCEVLSSYGGS